jgi:hypothetical protein
MNGRLTRRQYLLFGAWLVAAVLVFVWRRPVEWQHAYPWVEEGTISLPEYLSSGWRSLWAPVSGYLVIPAKLIFLTAISLSASIFPQIAYALTLAFEVGTLCLIAFSPTHIRYPWLAAMLVAVVPTQPEVFAVSEYAFWWGTLWSFVALFWREGERPRTAWRCILAVVGGLSSPIAIPVAVLLGARAIVIRKQSDVIVLAAGGLTAAIQVATLLTTVAPLAIGDRGFEPLEIVKRFFGHYVVSSPNVPQLLLVAAGLAIIGWMAMFTIAHKKWRDPWFILLAASLGAGVAASLSRVAVDVIQPMGAARYFFYPYLFLGWLLLYAYAETGLAGRVFTVVVLALGFSQFAMHGRQVYDTYLWPDELRRCIAAGKNGYPLPVQFNGDKAIAWHVALTGEQCESLVDRSMFR